MADEKIDKEAVFGDFKEAVNMTAVAVGKRG